MSDLILGVLIVAVIAGVCALIALPIIYVRGMRQIDAAMFDVFAERDERESQTNVRTLARWELARRMERNRRGGGDVA
jgi:hypothetical protein